MTGPRRPSLHKNEDDAARDLSAVLLSHPRGALQIEGRAERAERSETLPAPMRCEKIPGRRRSRTRNVIACWRALIGVSLAEIAEIARTEVPVPWVPLTL